MRSVTDIIAPDIQQAVETSGLQGYAGTYTELGGGEVNDTFLLDFSSGQIVLRIAKFDINILLRQEATALKLLHSTQAPKLLFFDDSNLIRGRMWVLESHIPGIRVTRLSVNQYRSLGTLLATVHTTVELNESTIDFWANYLDYCIVFGDESALLNHPDHALREIVRNSHEYFRMQKLEFNPIHKSLIHGDATPDNILANGDDVSLIDWEFAKFTDPMADFSTIYYPDMEYNKGRWRVKIKPDELSALFDGYAHAGGTVDERRLAVWMILDKLGAATYLFWKMHQSAHPIPPERLEQYRLDFRNLTESLSTALP